MLEKQNKSVRGTVGKEGSIAWVNQEQLHNDVKQLFCLEAVKFSSCCL